MPFNFPNSDNPSTSRLVLFLPLLLLVLLILLISLLLIPLLLLLLLPSARAEIVGGALLPQILVELLLGGDPHVGRRGLAVERKPGQERNLAEVFVNRVRVSETGLVVGGVNSPRAGAAVDRAEGGGQVDAPVHTVGEETALAILGAEGEDAQDLR